MLTSALVLEDLENGKKIAEMFDNFSEQSKLMAIVYMSALRDKEAADVKNTA